MLLTSAAKESLDFLRPYFDLSRGSTPTVGSSRMRSGGSCNIATANDTLLCWPPLVIAENKQNAKKAIQQCPILLTPIMGCTALHACQCSRKQMPHINKEIVVSKRNRNTNTIYMYIYSGLVTILIIITLT